MAMYFPPTYFMRIIGIAVWFSLCVYQDNTVAESKLRIGEIYKTIDQKQTITILSFNELELNTDDINLICEYSVKDNKVRAVAIVFGTKQALYFDVTKDGLKDQDGTVYYAPSSYEAAQREIDIARRGEKLTEDLVQAVSKGDVNTAKHLLDQGAAVDDLYAGKTPLVYAIRAGHIDMIKLLLSSGADPSDGEALYWAIRGCNAELAKILVKNGADQNYREENTGRTMLDVAIEGSLYKGRDDLRKKCGVIVKLLKENTEWELCDQRSSCAPVVLTILSSDHIAGTIYYNTHQTVFNWKERGAKKWWYANKAYSGGAVEFTKITDLLFEARFQNKIKSQWEILQLRRKV